jgi:hypothetical protein
MNHAMLPTQYHSRTDTRLAEPHKRLMAAVLQTVVDDCRGSVYRRARGYTTPIAPRNVRKATVYMASTDRTWPFSFENLCDALGVDAGGLRRELRTIPVIAIALPEARASVADRPLRASARLKRAAAASARIELRDVADAIEERERSVAS